MSPAVTRRSKALSSQLGLTERIFSSAADRAMAAAVEDGLTLVEDGLLRELEFADTIADATSRYLFAAGGKRVRPMLTLLTAQLGEGANPDVLVAAQAIEITHLASLYHDDVMDEAEQRRGVPSAQAVWGNSVAILTGDLLFARASKLVASLGERAILLQAETFERLVLGQLHETAGPQEGEDPIAHYINVLAGKTGSLIAAAAQMGVVFSNAPQPYEEAVVLFGERIGIAFQLVDDVIDLSPSADETGKIAGTDLRAGVPTLPLLYLRRRAVDDPADAELLERLERGIAGGDPLDLEKAIEDLRRNDVTATTIAEAHRWAASAVAALAPLPDGGVKKALIRFADVMVERSA
ncbi:polyprenyl synthetase family protein [Amnibacterium flavum]|uniref:Geranylgeranyl pyrophosphate synthase n=1 Tax=Amnibacterium flavum TaxID=2173173 RepID=A0A2V1HSR3_9MICO|nr:polyprenyl synthetase family protein [Amnibacterium flavum]PVZ95608.1 geranylgeranyl pyrophosphate synthase [Amnibacterium flavum]